MTNWRTVLNVTQGTQTLTQNPQNRTVRSDSEDFEQFEDALREAERGISLSGKSHCPTCGSRLSSASCACRKSLNQAPTTPQSALKMDWLGKWRALAQIACQIGPDDPRYDPLLLSLAECVRAYKAQDREQFAKQTEHVMRIATFVPRSVIQWRGHDKQGHGPSTVQAVIYEDGRLWACTEWMKQLYWVSEAIIEGIKPEGKAGQTTAASTL